MFMVQKIFMDYIMHDKKRCFVCIVNTVTNKTTFCKLQINLTMCLLQGDLIESACTMIPQHPILKQL